MQVKLCGFTEDKSLQAAIDYNCNFIGFIFCDKSPRNISLSQAKILGKLVPDHIAKVAVSVNADMQFLTTINDCLRPKFFQFHGNEDINYIKNFKEKFPQLGVIKAFSVDSNQNFSEIEKYSEFCDYFLFDSKSQNSFGGTGVAFDWKMLKDKNFTKKWFLSGGLNVGNIKQAIAESAANMIDISSGIEEIKGQKSLQLIADFMQKIKTLDVSTA